jgi:hypothetical protein
LALGIAVVVVPRTVESASRSGAWAERVQIVYLDDQRTIKRRLVRVWDPHPEQNLDFTWEPSTGTGSGIGDDGVITGVGKLVWRIKGSASYDPATIYSTYQGQLRNGRPDGHGILRMRTGEFLEGNWSDGLLNGIGTHLEADGDRYEGQFIGGISEGRGKLSTTAGEIFEGTFKAGLLNGNATRYLANGSSYSSVWIDGREIGPASNRTAPGAAPGFLQVSSTGDNPNSKIKLGISVDGRMNQQANLQYRSSVSKGEITISPTEDEMNVAWSGQGIITNNSDYFSGFDDGTAVFLEVTASTSDGSKAKFDSLTLFVNSSETYRKPMLSIDAEPGCKGYLPKFTIYNHGWGELRDAVLTINFVGAGKTKTQAFTKSIGNVSNGADIDIEDLLKKAGVDTQSLAAQRIFCRSTEGAADCKRRLTSTIQLGSLSEMLRSNGNFASIGIEGTIRYKWLDSSKKAHKASQPLETSVNLAAFKAPGNLAECGDYFGGAPEAARYQDVNLKVEKENYSIEIPIRGNSAVAKLSARLRVTAPVSSIHKLQIVARMADGSESVSKPVSLHFYRPRESNFNSSKSKGCYLERYHLC